MHKVWDWLHHHWVQIYDTASNTLRFIIAHRHKH